MVRPWGSTTEKRKSDPFKPIKILFVIVCTTSLGFWSQRNNIRILQHNGTYSIRKFMVGSFSSVPPYVNESHVSAAEFNVLEQSLVDMSTQANQVEIPRNQEASLASDITSIHHLPYQSKIVVNFHAQAHCPRPYLVGRLSGPALIRLEWTWSRERGANSTTVTVMTGTYDAPMTGEYFLEIIVVHCDDFAFGIETAFADPNPLRSHLLRSTGDKNPLTFDFARICAEDPFHAQVTSKTASIVVVKPTDKPLHGFWRKAAKVKNPHPVFTRFQPPVCYDDHYASPKRNLSQVCFETPTLDQFLDYDFEWSPLLQLSAPMLHQPRLTTVCYAGWSHAEHAVEAAGRLGLKDGQYNVTAQWVKARYPKNVAKQIPFMKEVKCDSLVIAVVQWPASYDRGHPTRLGPYYQDLKDMILRVRSELPEMKLFFRSVHTNPLAGRVLKCPPVDWRTPTAMNGYNKVIQHVCQEMNVTFLDETFLTGPVWDAPPDWSHLDERTADAEALYLTGSALGVVVNGKMKTSASQSDSSRLD